MRTWPLKGKAEEKGLIVDMKEHSQRHREGSRLNRAIRGGGEGREVKKNRRTGVADDRCLPQKCCADIVKG